MLYSATDDDTAKVLGEMYLRGDRLYSGVGIPLLCSPASTHSQSVDLRKLPCRYRVSLDDSHALPREWALCIFLGLYPKAGVLHPLFLAYFFGVSGLALWSTLSEVRSPGGIVPPQGSERSFGPLSSDWCVRSTLYRVMGSPFIQSDTCWWCFW